MQLPEQGRETGVVALELRSVHIRRRGIAE
jgi:hypothetical protein